MRRLCAQKQCNIITKYLHSQRIHVDRSICVWACPARCDLAPELWASGTAAVPGVQPIVTPVVVNWHSRLAKLRAAPHCRDGHLAQPSSCQLPPTLITHSCPTGQANTTGAALWSASPSSLTSLTCSTHAAFLSWSLRTEQKCVHGNLPCFALAMQSVATLLHRICYCCLFTWTETVNLSGDVLNYS